MIDRVAASERWRKASASSDSADCVEVPNTRDAVRDSKNPTVALPVPRRAFTRMMIHIVAADQPDG